jgi:hypothetical protein
MTSMSFPDGAGTDPARRIVSPEFLRQGARILRLPVLAVIQDKPGNENDIHVISRRSRN